MTRTRTAGAVAGVLAAAGVLTGIALTVGGSATAAPAAAPAQGAAQGAGQERARGCVGTWDVEVDRGPQAPALKLMLSVHADGTAIVSGAAAQASSVPGGAEVEFNSAGLGVWRAQRDGCLLRVKTLSNDERGLDSGSAVVEAALTVGSGGQALSGTASLRTTLPEGGGSGADGLRVTGARFALTGGTR